MKNNPYYPAPHPDEESDWRAFKEIHTGGNMALDDKAINAYHKTLEETGNVELATQKYFEVYAEQAH